MDELARYHRERSEAGRVEYASMEELIAAAHRFPDTDALLKWVNQDIARRERDARKRLLTWELERFREAIREAPQLMEEFRDSKFVQECIQNAIPKWTKREQECLGELARLDQGEGST
jgi:hypothetical protein